MSIHPDYKPDDFSQMLFNFYLVGDRDVFECFPVLKKYKEFAAPLVTRKKDVVVPLVEVPINKVLKYVAFCYDKGSPLQKIEDIIKKKVTAALLAGFEPTPKGDFHKNLDDIFRGNNTTVNLMIIRYCRLVRSRTYMVLVVGNETLQNTMKELMDNSGKKDPKSQQLKLKLLDDATKLAENMDKISLELLSNDNNTSLNNLLYAVSDMTEEEYINLTCEDFADKWPINHPEITARVDEDQDEVPVSAT